MEAIIVGSFGLWRKFLKESLESDGIEVRCFVDTLEQGTNYKGIPIVAPEEVSTCAKNFRGLILITFPVNNKRRKDFVKTILSYIGDENHVMQYTEVYQKYKDALLRAKEVGCLWLGKNYDKDRILGIIDWLADQKSKYIVESWLKFRETLDVNYLVEPEEPYYFPEELDLASFVPNEYSFLDLGAFTGDTYLFLKSLGNGLPD